MLGLLRDLRLGVLRWPGGNFVSNYHWADGIGPKDARPRRPELAWGGEESNRFGTDEFLAYCAELGAEPYICLNMGTGTLEEALAWVEYCNGARRTTGRTAARERPGRAVPGHYWGLGNEMYGEWQVGAMSAEEYVREATRWARAIKMLDPEAQAGELRENGWTDWDAVVIDGLAGLVDFHSMHIYTGSRRLLDERPAAAPGRAGHPVRRRALGAPPTCKSSRARRGSPTTSGTSGTGPMTARWRSGTRSRTPWRSPPT